MGRMNLSYKDYDDEGSSVTVRTIDLTAANFDANIIALNGLKDAIEAVTLAALQKQQIMAVETEVNDPLPASQYAQRESKWLVKYQQADGLFGSFEIPAADLTLLVSHSELMNVSAGAGQALVTAINGNVYGRDNALVTVIEIQHVGRST
jgi:hypothetical protein